MDKAFAYVCASAETSPRILKRYCRTVYELGYVPICPALSDTQYLSDESPDEPSQYRPSKAGALPDVSGLRQGNQPRDVGGDWIR